MLIFSESVQNIAVILHVDKQGVVLPLGVQACQACEVTVAVENADQQSTISAALFYDDRYRGSTNTIPCRAQSGRSRVESSRVDRSRVDRGRVESGRVGAESSWV